MNGGHGRIGPAQSILHPFYLNGEHIIHNLMLLSGLDSVAGMFLKKPQTSPDPHVGGPE